MPARLYASARPTTAAAFSWSRAEPTALASRYPPVLCHRLAAACAAEAACWAARAALAWSFIMSASVAPRVECKGLAWFAAVRP